jgi:hypothetical protein
MKISYILFLIVVVLYSCNKSKFDLPGLKFVEKKYPLLTLQNPVLCFDDTVQMFGESFKKIVYADTLNGMKFVDLILKYFPENDSFALHIYAQHWEDEQYKYFLRMKEDTLKYLKVDKRNNEPYFYLGEYDFKRTRNEVALTSFGDTTVKDDIIYYDMHRDSLRKVRGNNLPPLPSPTPEERDQWRAMQRERKDGINLDEF